MTGTILQNCLSCLNATQSKSYEYRQLVGGVIGRSYSEASLNVVMGYFL